MQSVYLVFFIFAGCVLVNAQSFNKGKMATGLLKENKPSCLLTRSRLGCACTTCQDVVSFTRMLILNHVPTEEEVLDKVCHRIFVDDKGREAFCENIVKKELPEIIKYVRNHIEPKQTCAKFC